MKKIWAIFLAMILSLSMIQISFAADDTSAEQTVRALGIISSNLSSSSSVSRGEFAQMLAKASIYKDELSGESSASPYKDVTSSDEAAESILLSVENGWMTGYVDGTFRPNQTVKAEEAAVALLEMLGYDCASLTGTFPNAQISKAKAVGLADGITFAKGQELTVRDCIYLFYNLLNAETESGQIYAETLGYSTTDDKVSYSSLVSEDLAGPFVLTDNDLQSGVPFSLSSAAIYRNGYASDANEAAMYDVYYYNTAMQTVWIYSNHVTGTYTAASPNATAPETATVAGTTYQLEAAASYKLSNLGEFNIGDVVTLLIGMDGTAVDVVSADAYSTTYYGIVTGTGAESYTTTGGSTAVERVVYVTCTDGVTRNYQVDETFEEGDLVKISFDESGSKVKEVSSKNISGKVDRSAYTIGSRCLTKDVNILHVSEDNHTSRIYLSALDGMTLSSSQVRYYVTNSNYEITDLIVYDVIGDSNQIGVITSVSEGELDNDGELIYTYTYIVNGVTGSGTSSNDIRTGGAYFTEENGTLKYSYALSSVSLSEVDGLTAVSSSGNNKYDIQEDAQCYIRTTGGTYTEVSVNSLDSDRYNLTGYVYNGNICVIIGREK